MRGPAAALSLALATLTACTSVPLPEREGVALYRRKCSACHRPYAPSERAPEKWAEVSEKMIRRAKLTPDEEARVKAYLAPDLPLFASH